MRGARGSCPGTGDPEPDQLDLPAVRVGLLRRLRGLLMARVPHRSGDVVDFPGLGRRHAWGWRDTETGVIDMRSPAATRKGLVDRDADYVPCEHLRTRNLYRRAADRSWVTIPERQCRDCRAVLPA